MKYRLMGALASGAVLAFALGSVANAADDGFCRAYAQAAVREVNHALEHGRCRDQMQGPRWSTDWRSHFAWCRHVSRDTAAGENEARRETLEACHHHDHDDGDDHGDYDHGGGYPH